VYTNNIHPNCYDNKAIKKKVKIAKALPREPLTRKRKLAIEAYVEHRRKKTTAKLFGESYVIVSAIIGETLKAERIKSALLYEKLHQWGYRWKYAYGLTGYKQYWILIQTSL